MVKPSPAFQFYPSDFLSDENVAMMDNREVGCYIKLICHCWKQGSIPVNMESLGLLCGEDESTMAELWANIKPCFRVKGKNRLIHLRLDRERKKQKEWRKKSSAGGKKSAELKAAKALKQRDSARVVEPKANRTLEPKVNSSSISISSPSSSIKELDTNVSNIDKVSKSNSNCPHEKIIELYHKTLPMCPQVRTWPDHLKSILRSRWKTKNQDSIEFWERFFVYVSHSKWLTGQASDWCANLEWLIRPTNFTKISNGSYHQNMNKTYKSMEGWIDAQR
ncbi:MAG TPA: DUF1376 domain-containing protein [Desulfobacterales bacterium]|nr:DUF1376 domain-containing protein [Desulfobacterales bacterium]